MMICFQLLQGIVRPLKSAHQSSAIERSRSAADTVLQASNQAASTNGSADQVVANSSRFSSLPSTSSRRMIVPTSAGVEHSSTSVESKTERTAGLRGRKIEPDLRTASTTDTKKAVDLNENLISSGRAPRATPSHSKSGETSKKPALIFVKPSDATIPSLPSPTVEQTEKSDSQDVATASTSSRTGLRSWVSSSAYKQKLGSKASAVEQTVGSDLAPAKSSSNQTDKSDLQDVATSSQAGTRSWVSSSGYRQKLGSQAASRYQSITSRLYGDSWLSSLGRGASRRSTRSATENASSSSLAANSSDDSQSTESLVEKTTADSPALPDSLSSSSLEPADALSQPAASKSALHLVYSCSTSSRSAVERPSLTSDDGNEEDDDNNVDDDDDNDSDDSGDDDGDGEAAGAARIGHPPKHSDPMLEEDVMRWRQRLVTSPPPRRAAHASRRYEDHEKEPGSPGTEVTLGRSVQSNSSAFMRAETEPAESPNSSESSKHVSFDPFTLSLNAALEGELDVLQSLFSEVFPV